MILEPTKLDTFTIIGETDKRTMDRINAIVDLAPERDQVLARNPVDKDAVIALANKYKESGLMGFYNSLLISVGEKPLEYSQEVFVETEKIIEYIREKQAITPKQMCHDFHLPRRRADYYLRKLMIDGTVTREKGIYWLTNQEA